MSLVNFTTREITCKIVYYGPGRSGKTRNLHYVYGRVPEARRGRMISLATQTDRTLFCSDLFHHDGDGEPLTEADLSERIRAAMTHMQAGPLANYIPYTHQTEGILNKLADLNPQTLAIMHGSSFTGDGAAALKGLAVTMRDVLGREWP